MTHDYDDNCIFCKIIKGEIPSSKVYEDEDTLAFLDIAPQAPEHILVIPKTHIRSAAEVTDENCDAAGKCFATIARVCKERGLDYYRVVSNCGAKAGQTVPHLHFHILSGCPLREKMI